MPRNWDDFVFYPYVLVLNQVSSYGDLEWTSKSVVDSYEFVPAVRVCRLLNSRLHAWQPMFWSVETTMLPIRTVYGA